MSTARATSPGQSRATRIKRAFRLFSDVGRGGRLVGDGGCARVWGWPVNGPSLAAVLFTDLVDSTAQRSKLGEDAADELRRTHDRLLGEAVETHGGRVVKSTGDGIMATFPGAAEAVTGAVAVQQAVDRHNRRADAIAPVSVRVGVSLGDVTWEDGDAFGSPVIEAARLCAKAEGGQILAADVVRVLAGSREGDRFSPVGDLDLKGLGPTTSWEIAWQPDIAPVIPVPGGLAPVGGFSFVGRSADLDLLDDAWRAAVDGQRRAVLVSGEPGIGKTRLISEFAHRAAAQGGVVLYGRAESELGVPYKPIVEALATYVRACPQQDLARQMGPLSGELTRLVPQLAVRLPDLDEPLQAEPETQRYRLFDAVAELVATASATWPLVLVLDDLQWAGKPTILLLGHLVASDPNMRVLVVGGYRDTEVGPDHPLTGLLAEIHRVGGMETLSLGGLGETEVAELTREAVGTDAGGLAQQVVGATDGNPFFVSEILRAATATGQAGEVDLAALGVPEGARAMVTARFNQLNSDRRPVLETAAVIGQRFDLPLLCAVIDDDELVLAALTDAEMAGLVGTQELLGGRQFAHALIRDALYRALTPTARVARHRQVLAALGTLPDADRRLGELAHHAIQAIDLVGVDAAVDYTRQAGERAYDDLAFEEAATYYEAAIDLLDQADQTTTTRNCDLQIALTTSLYQAGDHAAGTQRLLRAAGTAERLGDAERLARVALAADTGGLEASLRPGSDPVTDVAERALNLLDEMDSALRARLLSFAGQRVAHVFHQRSRHLASEAVRMARRLGDDSTLARVLQDSYTPLYSPDNLAERVRVLGDELIPLGERLGDVQALHRGHMYRAHCFMETCELDRAEAATDEAERLAGVLRQPAAAYYMTAARTSLALQRGQLDLAEQLIGEQLPRSEGLAENMQITAKIQLAVLLYQRGRIGDIRDAASALADEEPDFVPYRALLALVLANAGAPDAARGLLDELAPNRFAVVPRDALWFTVITALAYAAVGAVHVQAAGTLQSTLGPYADRVATHGHFPMGPVATALGSLAAAQRHYDEAERHLRAAVELCERWDLRSWLAFTRCHWAKMLTERNEPGDHNHARDLATHALTAAEQIGMDGVSRDARQVLTGLET